MNPMTATFCQNVTIKFRAAHQHAQAIQATEVQGAQFLVVDDSGPKYLKIVYGSQDAKTGIGYNHKELRIPHDCISEIDCTSLMVVVATKEETKS